MELSASVSGLSDGEILCSKASVCATLANIALAKASLIAR